MAYQKELHVNNYLGHVVHLLCFILTFGEIAVLVSGKGRDYYRAAVYEHVRYDDAAQVPPKEAIEKNLDMYAIAARTAAGQEADIIVFPEWGLYRHDKMNRSTVLPFAEDVPDPAENEWNPCEDRSLFEDRPVLRRLSCLARDGAFYVVANIADLKKCIPEETCETSSCAQDSRKCPHDGLKFFNTNVVFNRNGTLVSRYYKSHLYFEPDFNTPYYPKAAYFETDFGLFTTFICFDMTFREAVEAVEGKDVLNVAYPTFWYDHLPLMPAIQYQQAWAITNRVNLLAANVHLLGTGTIGSGIYASSKGALVYTFSPDMDGKLLISRVPMGRDFPSDFKTEAKIFRIRENDVKDITDEDQDSKVPNQCSTKILGPPGDLNRDYRCGELNTSNYVAEKLHDPEGFVEVCQKDTCCSLSYNADSMDEDFYLGVNTGIAWVYSTYGFCVEICMMVRCERKDSSELCSTYPLTSNTKFRHLKLRGNFTTKYVYPSVMESKMRLAPAQEWSFSNSDGQAQVTYDAESEDGKPLLAVGLYGRCYDRDPVFPL